MGIGAIPGIAFAPRVFGAFLPSFGRLELGVSYAPSMRQLVDGVRGGDFALFAVDTVACKSWTVGAFELGPCAVVEGGAVLGRGVGIRLPASGAAPWLAVGAGLEGAVRLDTNGALALGARLETEVAVARYRFEVDAVGLVYQPSAFAARASVRGELRF
jgi:hypothetical protein